VAALAKLRRLGIDLIYARKPRTKGKIENQFRFVQRDFVLENLHHTSLDDLNGAGRNGWNGRIGSIGTKGSMGTVPLILHEVLVLATAEELEVLLIHEDPRKVTKRGTPVTMASFESRMPTLAVGFGQSSKEEP